MRGNAVQWVFAVRLGDRDISGTKPRRDKISNMFFSRPFDPIHEVSCMARHFLNSRQKWVNTCLKQLLIM